MPVTYHGGTTSPLFAQSSKQAGGIDLELHLALFRHVGRLLPAVDQPLAAEQQPARLFRIRGRSSSPYSGKRLS